MILAEFEQLGPPCIVRITGCAKCGANGTLPRDIEVTPTEAMTFRYRLCLGCLQQYATLGREAIEVFQAEIDTAIERAMQDLQRRAQGGLRCGPWTV